MRTIAELREELSAKLAVAETIIEKADNEQRAMTAEEQDTVDAALAEADELRTQIRTLENQEALRQRVTDTRAAMERPADRRVPAEEIRSGTPSDITPTPDVRIVSRRYRYGPLKSFTGPHAEERAYRAGMWMRATLLNDYTAKRYCETHGIQIRTMTEGVNSAGGNLVPAEMEQAIIDNRETYGVFRQNVGRIIPMGRDAMSVPRRTGGLTASFVGESATASETDKSWDQVQLVAKKMSARTRMSSELAEDAIINLADDLAGEIAYAFANLEDTIGFDGAGTAAHGSVQGIIPKIEGDSSLAGHVTVSTVNTFSGVTNAALATLMSVVPQYARMNAKFYCSQVAFDLVFSRLAAAGGGNTIQTFTGEYRPAYLGYPIVVTQVMETSTGTVSNGDHLLAFGDLSKACVMGERRGISLSLTDQRYWDTDEIGIKGSERVDIVAHDVGDSSTAGPLAVLIAQS